MTTGSKASTNKRITPATIAIGAQTTGEINLQGDTLVGIFTDSHLTGTTMTFQAASAPGGTYESIVDSANAAISFTVAVSKYISLTQDQMARFVGVQNLKVNTGTNQSGSATTLTFVTRPVK